MADSISSSPPILPQMKSSGASKGLVSTLRDFPDRLSPMVVKELRQGLRSPIFVWAFMVMHLVLAFSVLISFGTAEKRDATTLFWWTVVVPLVFILPLRGFNALTEERRLNTHDTLVLTKLNAFRITAGKWAAIAAQVLLLSVTILPYLVMRYFAGAVNISLELRWLVHFTTLGLLFAAGTVGFSWVKYFILRGALTLGMGFGVFMACGVSIFGILSRYRFSKSSAAEYELAFTAGAYVLAAFVIFYLLDFAAAQIAPLSENRSTLRRIVSFAVVIGFCAAMFFSNPMKDFGSMLMMAALGMAAFVGIDAATEQPRHFTVICQPFVKRGILGRLAGRFLYPGWHSGFLYLLLLAACALGTMVFFIRERFHTVSSSYGMGGDEYALRQLRELGFVSLVVIGQILFGLLILRLVFKNSQIPLILFILVQSALGLLQGLLLVFSVSTRTPALNLIAFPSPISHAAFIESSTELAWENQKIPHGEAQSALHPQWLYITGAVAVIYLLALLFLVRREFRKTRELERQVIQDSALENSHV